MLFFIVSGSLIACNNNQIRKNTGLVQQNLKGKVQTVTEITTNIDSAGNVKSDSTIKISDFNIDGYITTTTSKDANGNIIETQTILCFGIKP